MSGGGAESGTATIKAMVGASCSGYTRAKSGACSSGGGRRNLRERVSMIRKVGGRDNEMTRRTKDNQTEI